MLILKMVTMLIDIHEFVSLFLTGNNLQNVICHLCNQSAGLVADPITQTLTVMASTPVSVVITEAGVAMFRNQPAMVWPYVHMTSEQLLYIKKIVDQVVENSIDGPLKLHGHVQMGGGCIVMIPSSKQHKDVLVDGKQLVHAFVASIGSSPSHDNWTKRSLSCILIQRLSCAVNLPKDALLSSSEYSDALFS
jgi:hypothetical protein